MATNGDLAKRLLAGAATAACLAAVALALFGRFAASAQTTQGTRRPKGRVSAVSVPGPLAQPPVRPRPPLVQGPQGPAPQARPIRGEVDLGKVAQAFNGAIVVITLERAMGPNQDVPADKVAELRFYNISKPAPQAPGVIAFTFGDFVARPNARYNLQCYLDINANGVRDAGDFWNERQVIVLTPVDPVVVRIEDLVPVR
jgi:hypothetical protein